MASGGFSRRSLLTGARPIDRELRATPSRRRRKALGPLLAAVGAASASMCLISSLKAATTTASWSGSANTANWGTSGNWNALPVSTNALYFGATNNAGTTTLIDNLTTGTSSFSVAGITFASGAHADGSCNRGEDLGVAESDFGLLKLGVG